MSAKTKWKSLSSSTNQPTALEDSVNPKAKMRATLATVEKMTHAKPNTRKNLKEMKEMVINTAKTYTHTVQRSLTAKYRQASSESDPSHERGK